MGDLWTEKAVVELKRLWGEGFSSSAIRLALGVRSRSQINGKLRRLGLRREASPKPAPPSRPTAAAARRRRHPAPLAAPAPAIEARIAPAPLGRLTILKELEADQCRWPLSSPPAEVASLTLFCGAPVEVLNARARRKRRSPCYCPSHSRLSRFGSRKKGDAA